MLRRVVYFITQIKLPEPQRKYLGPDTRTRINKAIRAPELRVVGPKGENLGTLSLAEALKEAEKRKLDLIEISPKAKPRSLKSLTLGNIATTLNARPAELKRKLM